MRKTAKRTAAVLLSVMMVLGLFTVLPTTMQASAAAGGLRIEAEKFANTSFGGWKLGEIGIVQIGDFLYSMDKAEDGGYICVGYCGNEKSISIPEKPNGAFYEPKVTEVDLSTDWTVNTYGKNNRVRSRNLNNVESVLIPTSVRKINKNSFSKMDSLTRVSFYYSYYENKSGDPETYNHPHQGPDCIDDYAFSCNPNLQKVNFDSECDDCYRTFGKYVMSDCPNLKYASLPEGVSSLGIGFCNKCYRIENGIVKSPSWLSSSSWLYASNNYELTGDARYLYDEYAVFNGLVKRDTLELVATIEDINMDEVNKYIKVIGESAFENTARKSVKIGDKVTEIKKNAFKNANKLTDVYFQGSNEQWNKIKIGSGNECLTKANIHFKNVNGFEYVALDSSTAKITKYTKDDINVTIPSTIDGKTVTKISEKVFSGKQKLKVVYIPETVKTFGAKTFANCPKIETVRFTGTSSKATALSSYMFYNCPSLKYISIPASVKTIGSQAFGKCTSLETATIPTTVTTMGSSAYSGCTSLTTVKIGNGLTAIPDYAFKDCTALNAITFGSKVNTLGYCAFKNTGFTSITIPGSVTSTGESVFSSCANLKTVKIGSGLKEIGKGMFNYCTALTSVNLGSKITAIGNNALLKCTAIKSITLPYSLKTIGDKAFNQNTSLKDIKYLGTETNWSRVKVGEGNTSITAKNLRCMYGAKEMFNYSKKSDGTIRIDSYKGIRTAVSIPTSIDGCSVSEIAANAFKDNKKVTSIDVANTVKKIGTRAFANCSALQKLTIGHSATALSAYMAANCTSLTKVSLGGCVKTITSNAFYNCPKLESFTMFSKVEEIGANAFYNCKAMTAISLPESLKTVGASAFAKCAGLANVTFAGSKTTWNKIDIADGNDYLKNAKKTFMK